MSRLAEAFRSAPALIILSIILIFLEFYVSFIFIWQTGRPFIFADSLALAFFVSFTALCFFFIPLIISKFIAQESLTELGLQLPQNSKQAIWLVSIALLLLIPISFLLAQDQAIHRAYTLNISFMHFISIVLLAFIPYYFFEEFFFRGYLFMGLWKKIGWHSYWITECLFMWAHLNKPLLEILVSFPIGLALNYLTLKTRSILPAIIAHLSIGVVVSMKVNYL